MNQHHFLIVSFPIQGHINPILQLAKNLARGGTKVTFATTVHGLGQIRHSLPSLERLSYTSFSDGNEEQNNESGSDISFYMENLRLNGSKNLTKIVQDFRDKGEPVTCLVYSLLFPWVAEVGREMNVPSAFLAIQCATVFAIYHHFFKTHDIALNGGFDSSASITIPGLPVFGSNDLPTFLLSGDKLSGFMIPMMREHMEELEKDPEAYVFLNTFQELEPEAIKALGMNLNVVPIGPLVPSAFCNGDDLTDKSFGGDLCIKSEDYTKWLDSKPEQSVIYVAFGSLVVIKKEQKIEIMRGLMESKRPFMWVIRASDSDEKAMKEMLENEASCNGDGIIVPWCSQVEVLSHKSLGCFVTHCGWNSTLESLISGVPIVGLPHFSDQSTDAKMLEDVWGTGVRARANGEVMVTREEFKKCLDMVMGDGERGRDIRVNAGKWKEVALEAVREGGSTYNNLKMVLENSKLK